MKNIGWKIALILVVLLGLAWSAWPPSERIRLGKDLRGGVSLIYHVKIESRDPDPQGTLNQVISVLKDRVNPTGVLDISMLPMGFDRIEIVMPLPSEKVRGLRRTYEQAMEDLLRRAQISEGDLQASLEAHTAIERFGGGAVPRREMIEQLQDAYDAVQASIDALQQAQKAGGNLGPLQQAQADAEYEFEKLKDQVLAMSIDRGRVERALRLSTDREPQRDEQGQPVTDAVTGQPVLKPSPRDVELDDIKSKFPYVADGLDALVTAYDDYAAQRKGFDDPEDLMRLLRGAGVLEYHIAVRSSDPEGVNPQDLRSQLAERGPANTDSPIAAWFPINDLKQWYDEPEQLARLQADPVSYFGSPSWDLVAAERDGKYYLLLYITDAKSMTHEGGRKWAITGTRRTVDNFGRPAVGFSLDPPGGMEMNKLTGAHVGEPMAIVLDGEVYSAPRINQAINQDGIIQGNFSSSELNYLMRVLAAGSLEARLSPEPIAINTLGPSIGADNLHRGMEAFVVSVIAVAAFMMLYYFFAGLVADFALIANGVIIFGFMSLIDGMFTLPGLAGIVLTIGMAVDANVLIYERVREEIFAGEVDLRGAVRLGYSKALSTIIDANVTNLIVCFVLFQTATTEVKGFALTLSIGICATLFTALFVTRVIYELYTDYFKIRRLPMLATVFPAVHRLLEPDIDWIGLRKYFITLSGSAVVVSIVLVAIRGQDMFDTEFRGGVAITMRTAAVEQTGDEEPQRLLLPQTGPDGAETRVRALADLLDTGNEETKQRFLSALHNSGVIHDETPESLAPVRSILREMGRASVLTVGRTVVRDGVVNGTEFQVKVASPKGLGEDTTTSDVVVAAVVAEFGDELDITRPLTFAGAGSDEHAKYTFPITRDTLGDDIDRPRALDRVTEYLGGVAVVLNDIDPPVTLDDVSKRISRMRGQPDFSECLGRNVGVFGLERAKNGPGYTSVAVTVFDPLLSYFDVDFDVWDRGLAQTEWKLVSQALQRQTSLEGVSAFSSAVAETLSAKAVVAVVLSLLGILVYVWIRFGSLRYSAAAIVALIHDVAISLGLLAVTGWLGGTWIASKLLIEEFRIDLGVVAALLTIIGYSLNDTIVILDRIRENRGKLPIATPDIVNRSINQTISRTVLTSFTTLVAVAIMYVAGGSGIRPFAFCLLAGLVVGTYSSIAIAAPLVVRYGGAGPPATD